MANTEIVYRIYVHMCAYEYYTKTRNVCMKVSTVLKHCYLPQIDKSKTEQSFICDI